MPYSKTFYSCIDCEKLVGTRNRIRTNVCKSCNAKRNICLIRNKGIKPNKKKPFEHSYNSLIRNAKKCNRKVLISYEEFLTFTKILECHYCGESINWSQYSRANKSSNYFLDRKDNRVNYEIDNLVVCCPKCNRIKSNEFTYSEFVKLIKFIKEMRNASK